MPSATPRHRPRSQNRRRVRSHLLLSDFRRRGAMGKLLLVALILLGVTTGVVLAWQGKLLSRSEEKSSLITEAVKRGPLEITITERGSLESANNQTLV
jgi:hypothetical protein